jgi:DNA polymerase-3 subunit gamma/tau
MATGPAATATGPAATTTGPAATATGPAATATGPAATATGPAATATGPRPDNGEGAAEELDPLLRDGHQANDHSGAVSGAVINISAIILAAGVVVGVHKVFKYRQI